MTPWEWLKRRFASRGFGVHSPLGFRLVRHVVRPSRDVAYYGEEKLEAMGFSSAVPDNTVRRAKLLLRFVAEMQPSYVWLASGLPEIYSEAVRLAGCVVRIYDGAVFPDDFVNADLVVTQAGALRKGILEKVLVARKQLVAFDVPESVRKTVENKAKGVALEGDGSLLVVNTCDPQLHYYKVSRF